ncbi:4-aminobutyrate--2-oxoglutarate transaminase [Neoroseomonas oryzicola]|uniref:4-aminobutyrate--2-oxoglutarate transaminase n=1 Tax=Neoroseomonas oryzicola TaxID=535904 RepID=A0A9X9WBD2_9PROT|nr:4-aminobutyrate--2-oxoglutarate transaminase [Neoroseomonas oryzicola]MBR0657642.1 4-aminobutyrate--2-oxoglutarate transaminase [Neoroseomonas oryzicola]NKE18898.1 4-aminobutyrate--2-oxoglutarate transaminase [Neoroseomonas oryzicola]
MLETRDRTATLIEERTRHVPRGVLTAHPIVLERAQGAEAWDVDGRRYLDFVGGIGVLNLGHNHPRVVGAVQEQLGRITHAAFQVAAYPSYLDLARRLSALVGGGEAYKAAFFTSGAEAVENAVKIARAHTNRPAVIAFRGGFHGRTLLGTTLTGMSAPYRQNFGPFAPEIFHTPFPNPYRGVNGADALAALEDLFATEVAPERVAAILIEPVQGDGGFLPAPPGFLQALQDLARRHGIVLILDEIQSGFGRTGKLFAFEHAGLRPDLVTVAKSLAGGLPLSGVVGRAEIMDAPTPGGLGGTYGGNGLACAAALGVLDAFEQDGLLARAEVLGTRLRAGLQALQQRYAPIGEVRGLGFMLAMEIVADRASRKPDADMAQRIIDAARDEGLLVIKCGVHRNVIRFLAPLVTTDAQLDEGLDLLDRALARSAA